jgi:hypothetical protein
MANRKRTNSDQQNTTQKVNDRATPVNIEGELMCSGRVDSSRPELFKLKTIKFVFAASSLST